MVKGPWSSMRRSRLNHTRFTWDILRVSKTGFSRTGFTDVCSFSYCLLLTLYIKPGLLSPVLETPRIWTNSWWHTKSCWNLHIPLRSVCDSLESFNNPYSSLLRFSSHPFYCIVNAARSQITYRMRLRMDRGELLLRRRRLLLLLLLLLLSYYYYY